MNSNFIIVFLSITLSIVFNTKVTHGTGIDTGTYFIQTLIQSDPIFLTGIQP